MIQVIAPPVLSTGREIRPKNSPPPVLNVLKLVRQKSRLIMNQNWLKQELSSLWNTALNAELTVFQVEPSRRPMNIGRRWTELSRATSTVRVNSSAPASIISRLISIRIIRSANSTQNSAKRQIVSLPQPSQMTDSHSRALFAMIAVILLPGTKISKISTKINSIVWREISARPLQKLLIPSRPRHSPSSSLIPAFQSIRFPVLLKAISTIT